MTLDHRRLLSRRTGCDGIEKAKSVGRRTRPSTLVAIAATSVDEVWTLARVDFPDGADQRDGAGPASSGLSFSMLAPSSGLLAPWWQTEQLTLGPSPSGPSRSAGHTLCSGIR